jgi:hypothetical protein
MPNIADSPAVTLPLLPTDRLYGERDGVAVKEFAMGDIVALAQQGAATPAQIAAAVTAHESASDPHPAYMTPAEAALAHAPLAHTHTVAQISDAGAAGRTLLQMATLAEIQSAVSGYAPKICRRRHIGTHIPGADEHERQYHPENVPAGFHDSAAFHADTTDFWQCQHDNDANCQQSCRARAVGHD